MRSKTECSDSLLRAEDGGGLLIHPALFVLTPFHLYSIIYDAVVCARLPHLQARVHQECTEVFSDSVLFALGNHSYR